MVCARTRTGAGFPPSPMNSRLLAVLASALALLAGCSEPPATKAKAEILAAENAFNALSQKDGPKAALLAFVAGDGKLLSESMQGAEGINAMFLQLPAAATLSRETSFVDASSTGDLGYTWGHYTLSLPLPKFGPKPYLRKGTYVTIWRRQPSGSWKIALDGGLPDGAK